MTVFQARYGFDKEIARLGALDEKFEKSRVFIIATALTHGYGVATRNQSDFELIGRHLPSYAPDFYLAIWKS